MTEVSKKEDVGFEQWPDRPLTREELSVTTDSLGLGIDPDILPLIIDLNEAGYATGHSCSGDSPNHPFKELRHGRKAWVDFKHLTFEMLTEETLEELDSIIKDNTKTPYSLEGVSAETQKKRAKLRRDIAREEPEYLEELDRKFREQEERSGVRIEFRGPIS